MSFRQESLLEVSSRSHLCTRVNLGWDFEIFSKFEDEIRQTAHCV